MNSASINQYPDDRWRNYSQIAWDYLQLTRPRFVALLVFTAIAAFVIAGQNQPVSISALIATLTGGWLCAAGASVIHWVLNQDRDKHHSYPQNLPIQSSKIKPVGAILFGILLLGLSIFIYWNWANHLTALLAVLGFIYYDILYTLLFKKVTVLKVFIRGGADAIPVLVGWAAATGTLSLQTLILFSIVLFWAPPHSWALAVLANVDYKKHNLPKIRLTLGLEVARRQMIWYALMLVAISLLPLPLDMLSYFYLVSAGFLGAGLIWLSLRLYRHASKIDARLMYHFSSVYLSLLFLAMILDRIVYRIS